MSIFGDVVSVDLPRDNMSIPRGFAFVEYSNENGALKAIAIKNIRINDSIATIIPYKANKRRYRRFKKKEEN